MVSVGPVTTRSPIASKTQSIVVHKALIGRPAGRSRALQGRKIDYRVGIMLGTVDAIDIAGQGADPRGARQADGKTEEILAVATAASQSLGLALPATAVT